MLERKILILPVVLRHVFRVEEFHCSKQHLWAMTLETRTDWTMLCDIPLVREPLSRKQHWSCACAASGAVQGEATFIQSCSRCRAGCRQSQCPCDATAHHSHIDRIFWLKKKTSRKTRHYSILGFSDPGLSQQFTIFCNVRASWHLQLTHKLT